MILQVNLVLMKQCDIRKKDGENCLDVVKRDNINPDWLIGSLAHQCCGAAEIAFRVLIFYNSRLKARKFAP